MMTKLSFWVIYSFKAILYTSILSLFGSPQQSDTHNRFGTFLHLMPFLPQPRPESGTHANSVLGHTHSFSQTFTHYGQFPLSNSSIRYVFGLWGNRSTLRKPTQTLGHAQRICQFHTESHPGSAGTWTRDLLAVRQQCNPPSQNSYIPLYYFT